MRMIFCGVTECGICGAAVGKQAATMPEELLHEREYSRTGIAPAGSNSALVEMTAHDSAASAGSDAELGKAGPKHAQQQQHQAGIMLGKRDHRPAQPSSCHHLIWPRSLSLTRAFSPCTVCR